VAQGDDGQAAEHTAALGSGRHRARLVPGIVFAADRNGPNYVSGLTDDDIAGILCRAAGHWGSGAEYLMETVDHLERLGIRDANL